jgi:hypothetical protein
MRQKLRNILVYNTFGAYKRNYPKESNIQRRSSFVELSVKHFVAHSDPCADIKVQKSQDIC